MEEFVHRDGVHKSDDKLEKEEEEQRENVPNKKLVDL